MRVDMFVDMCGDICADMCVDMHIDMCVDMCVDMRADMRVDTRALRRTTSCMPSSSARPTDMSEKWTLGAAGAGVLSASAPGVRAGVCGRRRDLQGRLSSLKSISVFFSNISEHADGECRGRVPI